MTSGERRSKPGFMLCVDPPVGLARMRAASFEVLTTHPLPVAAHAQSRTCPEILEHLISRLIKRQVPYRYEGRNPRAYTRGGSSWPRHDPSGPALAIHVIGWQ